MGFLWRRRSSLVKIVILLSAVWFTIAFLIYTEDRSGNVIASGPHSLELKYNNEFNDDFDDNSIHINNNNNNNNNIDDKILLNKLNYVYNNNNPNSVNQKNETFVNNVILNGSNREPVNIKNVFSNNNVNSNNLSKHKRLNRKDSEAARNGALDDSGEYLSICSVKLCVCVTVNWNEYRNSDGVDLISAKILWRHMNPNDLLVFIAAVVPSLL